MTIPKDKNRKRKSSWEGFFSALSFGFRFFVSGWGENEKTHIKFVFLLT